MSELEKGKLLRQDAHLYDGRRITAKRKSSAGGVVVGLRFGDEVDVLSVYGNGVDRSDITIQNALNAIGSSNTTLKFSPGTWSIKTNVTVGSNFACLIPDGVTFDVASGITLTFNGPVVRYLALSTSGAGTVTEAGTRSFTGLIDLSGAVLQGASPLVFEGATQNAFEMTFVVTDPTADRTLTMPDKDVDLGDVGNVSNSPQSFDNVAIAATVAANALTLDLRTKDLGDPTSNDVSKIGFRNATAATGDYVIRSITGALDITVPAGATLGFTSSETGFIYIYVIDNTGTVELAVSKKAIFDETQTLNTTILNTSSDDDSTLYSTTARTAVAVRLLGRVKITTASTAGNWDAAPTVLTVWTPSMKRTGDVIQTVIKQDGAEQNGTTVHVLDDTIPQNTEGIEFMTQAITPTDAENRLLIESSCIVSNTAGGNMIAALFQDSTADALKAIGESPAGTALVVLDLLHEMAAGTTSATTMKIRAGAAAAGTTTFNGTSSARELGGVMGSFLRISEIQA